MLEQGPVDRQLIKNEVKKPHDLFRKVTKRAAGAALVLGASDVAAGSVVYGINRLLGGTPPLSSIPLTLIVGFKNMLGR